MGFFDMGFLESLSFMASVALAVPMVYAGVSIYWAGQTFGLLFVAMGVLLVVAERYLTTPADVPGIVADKTVGRVLPGDSEEQSTEE